MSTDAARTVPVFDVVTEAGKFISAFATAAKAEGMAERIGACVRVAQIAVGERVIIRWHGHAKSAEVVGAAAAKVVVRFVPRAGAAPIERAVGVETVERRRR